MTVTRTSEIITTFSKLRSFSSVLLRMYVWGGGEGEQESRKGIRKLNLMDDGCVATVGYVLSKGNLG